jgi:serine phosphatase RsbU (regulator of sigma subunit)
MVITRNNPSPVVLSVSGVGRILTDASLPIGIYRGTRPVINELPLEPGLIAVVYTDGLVHAGERTGDHLDVLGCLETMLDDEYPSPQMIADTLLEQALALDEKRPVDDISVVVVAVSQASGDEIRRMSVRLPLRS